MMTKKAFKELVDGHITDPPDGLIERQIIDENLRMACRSLIQDMDLYQHAQMPSGAPTELTREDILMGIELVERAIGMYKDIFLEEIVKCQ